jgi:Uma2 family endonuclease
MATRSVRQIHRHTYEAYLEYESSSNVKHEFIDGDIYAMAGGSVVIYGAAERDPKSRDVILNPSVVAEVTSDSTEEWDRGEKLDHYKQIPSLQACVLVSHKEKRLEVVSRVPGGWRTESATVGEAIHIGVLGCRLEVDDVYRNVDVRG